MEDMDTITADPSHLTAPEMQEVDHPLRKSLSKAAAVDNHITPFQLYRPTERLPARVVKGLEVAVPTSTCILLTTCLAAAMFDLRKRLDLRTLCLKRQRITSAKESIFTNLAILQRRLVTSEQQLNWEIQLVC